MLKFNFTKYSIRIVLPSFLAIVLFVLLIFTVIIPNYERNVIYAKKLMLKELTNVVYNLIKEYEEKGRANGDSLINTKEEIILLIENLRYGPENKDYFWIMDTIPNIIMHPFLPELNGQYVGDYRDSSGTYLFNNALKETKVDGEGFINYIWQWKDDASLLLNKVSFVKLYPSWGWIIGTGIYFDDIEKEMSGFKRNWIIVSALASLVIISLLFYIVRQSLLVERKREIAEIEIKKLNESLERRVENRTKKLNQAYQELESIAYTISHDLSSPLRHIRNFINKLYLSISEPSESISKYYQKADDTSKIMSHMIEELVSLLNLGRKELEYQQIEVENLIYEVIDKFETNKKEIEWKVKELFSIKGDWKLLKQAFYYLISNAIKFSTKNTKIIIEIGAIEYDTYVEFYVKDNGVGFDMRYMDKLFGVFQKLHNDLDFEGVGIGLAKVKKIIDKHNGSIRTESKIDSGSTFFIKLPK